MNTLSRPRIPFILSVCRSKRIGWQGLGQIPITLQQAKNVADAIVHREEARPVAVRVFNPLSGRVVYLIALAGRRVRADRSASLKQGGIRRPIARRR